MLCPLSHERQRPDRPRHLPPRRPAPPGLATQAACLAGLKTSTYNFLYVGWEAHMRTMTYSESRAKYAETLNAVVDDREEVVITRAGHDPVVIVALDDYESLKETAYLLKSPENARRLLTSIDRLEHGGGTQRDLAE
jgi:antitoxin YefM